MKTNVPSFPNNLHNAFRKINKALLLFLLFIVASGAAKSQTPSTNINSYVLFAYSEFHFKGRNGGDLTRAVIEGGNVGVNSCLIPNTKNLTFGGPVTMPTDGSQVVGYDVRVEPGCDIWELYAKFVQTAFDPSVLRNGPYHDYTCPLIAASSLPSLPSITPGVIDITVAEDDVVNLAPGNYANVRVNDRGTLNLSPGLYQFNSMNSGKNVRIMTTDGTEVRVAADMPFNDNAYVGPSNFARFLIRSDNVSLNDATVAFSRQGEFHGQYFLPNGRINLGDHTDLFGRFWADKISSDFNVSVHYFAPPTENIPLPVELVSFTAKRINGNVQLKWMTATEINNSGFEIQRRSGNSMNFEKIAFVDSKASSGNSSIQIQYEYSDANNSTNETYYRLKQVDIDGHTKYSEVRVVNGSKSQSSMLIYPNPAVNSDVTVSFSTEELRNLQLTDMSGHVINNWKDYKSTQLRINQQLPGMYILRVMNQSGETMSLQKIVFSR